MLHPLSPNPNHEPNQPYPITYSENILIEIPFAKMRQPNGYGSVRNDETVNFTWDLVQDLQPASPLFSKAPATSVDSICSNKSTKKKQKKLKKYQTVALEHRPDSV